MVVLFVIALASCLASAAALGYLIRYRIAGLRRWLWAHAVLACALGELLFEPRDTPPVVVVTVSTLVVVSALLFVQGCRQFAGEPPVRRREQVLLAVLVVALLYWSWFRPDVNLRAAMISAVLVYARLALARIVWRSCAWQRAQYGLWFVVVAAVAGALVHAARVVQCLFFADPHARFLDPSPLNLAFVAAGILSLPFLSGGLLMLTNERIVQEARQLAAFDDLTGALVRRAFMARAEALLARARASKSPLSVALIDIDNFKAINDQYGHPVGDRVLRQFGMEVMRHIRSSDVFGRLGGEEFGLLFPEADRSGAARAINAILAAVAGHRATPESAEAIRFSFSAGIEECGQGDTVTSVIGRADAALYRAKRAGKSRIELAGGVG